jgi:hypothetical protein
VSKRTFLAALKERGAVMFCPGGQAELVHAWRSFLPETQRELVLQKKHKGFCRCAVVFCASSGATCNVLLGICRPVKWL